MSSTFNFLGLKGSSASLRVPCAIPATAMSLFRQFCRWVGVTVEACTRISTTAHRFLASSSDLADCETQCGRRDARRRGCPFPSPRRTPIGRRDRGRCRRSGQTCGATSLDSLIGSPLRGALTLNPAPFGRYVDAESRHYTVAPRAVASANLSALTKSRPRSHSF